MKKIKKTTIYVRKFGYINGNDQSQKNMCMNYCQLKNLQVEKVIIEAGSCRNNSQRAQFLSFLSDGETTDLIVTSLDRLTRNSAGLELCMSELHKMNITLHVTQTQETTLALLSAISFPKIEKKPERSLFNQGEI